MRAIQIQDGFGLDHLALAERPDPRPGPGQVVLRMHAAALNYRDLLMARGEYDSRQRLPLVPCSDGVGEVVVLGPGVERVALGDRVATIFAQKWLAGEPTREKIRSTLGGPLDGTLAEMMAVDAEGLVRVPEHLTHEEGATLPCAGLTAWSALVTLGGVKAGDTILVQGTGGVSIFALQLGRLCGAQVIVTSGSDEKLERARALGAWATINYKSVPDWGRQAAKLAGGVDLVIDVGGGGTLEQSLAAVRPGGQISQIGILSGAASAFSVIPIHMKQVRVQGVLVGNRETFEAMNRAIAASGMRPVVDRVYPLEESRAAFEHLASGKHFGKICIRIS